MNFKKDLVSFEGRINRQPYAQFILVIWVLSAILGWMVDSSTSGLLAVLVGIISLVMAISAISFGVRRLHDLDKSGWWVLIALIPIVGFFFQLYLLFAKGTDGYNRFGEDPLIN